MWSIENGVFSLSSQDTIDAPLPVVYEVVSDVTKYPEFINDVLSADLQGEICVITLRVGPMKIPLKTKVEWVPPHLVQFALIEGPVKSLMGRWSLEERGNSTAITLTTRVEAGPLGQWMMRTASKIAERQIRKVAASFQDRIAKRMYERDHS